MPFIRRIRATNFRSIARCDVTLGPLTVLLGFNAAGKSNFLDILRFTKEALTTSPAAALANRGGLDAVLHRSSAGRSTRFGIHLDVDLGLPNGEVTQAAYRFGIGVGPDGGTAPVVLDETLDIGGRSEEVVGRSKLRMSLPFLGSDGSLGALLDEQLEAMQFYELDSTFLRELDESPSPRPILGARGEHLGPVVGYLADLLQPHAFAGRIPLVGIEEPETALHPAGVSALYEALDDASARTQVIVTSQSSDLLDSEYASLDHIRAVANVDGATRIGPVDAQDEPSSKRA